MGTVLFDNVESLAESGYVFRIQYDGGACGDCYTVAFCDDDYLALSAYPSHPQGISQWGQGVPVQGMDESMEQGTAVDMALGDLPQGMAEHVVYRVNQAWRDFLKDAEAGNSKHIAPSRDKAEENEGTQRDAGKGIYVSKGAYLVRLDGPEDDDKGPYGTVREALIATLPTDYSLSGPEYHSTVNVERTIADDAVSSAMRALETRVKNSNSKEDSLSLFP